MEKKLEGNAPDILTLDQVVAKDVFDKEFKKVKEQIGNINMVMGGVIIVFFIAFMAFVLDAWRFHANSYKDFSFVLSEQQKVVENYNDEGLPISIQELKKEIAELENKLLEKRE